jgi:hypothetical protein
MGATLTEICMRIYTCVDKDASLAAKWRQSRQPGILVTK